MDDYLILGLTNFRGGMSPEKRRGPPGSFWYGENLDIRNGENTLKPNLASMRNDGGVVTSMILAGFEATDGQSYAFGTTNIYRKDTSGIWEVVYTMSSYSIWGAVEFTMDDGTGTGTHVPYIIFVKGVTLYKIKLSDAGTGAWASASVTIVGVVNDYYAYHTMRIASGAVLIADGNWVASISYDGSFNAQAFQAPSGSSIHTIGARNSTALFGTSGISEAWLYAWTYGNPTWTLKERVGASSVQAMIPIENGQLLVCNGGKLRYWDYVGMTPLGLLRGVDATYSNAITQFDTIAHFGMYSDTGNGTANAIYTYGRIDKNQTLAINLEYTLSPTTPLVTSQVKAMWQTRNGLLVAWENGFGNYGVDMIGFPGSFGTSAPLAIYESLEQDLGHPESEKVVRHVKVVAQTPIPTGCTVVVKVKATRDANWVQLSSEDGNTEMVAGDYKRIFNAENMGEVFQVRLELNSADVNHPEISGIFVYCDMDNNI